MKIKGYVALTAVLVMIPLLLLTGMELLYRNITLLSTAKTNYDWQVLRTYSETCLEESLYKLVLDENYTGEFDITQEDWACTSNITNIVGEDGFKLIVLETSNPEGINILLQKKVDTNYDPFKLYNIE